MSQITLYIYICIQIWQFDNPLKPRIAVHSYPYWHVRIIVSMPSISKGSHRHQFHSLYIYIHIAANIQKLRFWGGVWCKKGFKSITRWFYKCLGSPGKKNTRPSFAKQISPGFAKSKAWKKMTSVKDQAHRNIWTWLSGISKKVKY